MANNKQGFETKQETGYSDPLSNCADFNILNFINSSDSPDLRYNSNSYHMNGHGVQAQLEQQQMQQMQHRQQVPAQGRQYMNPVILDNGILYNGTTRLPESPPITDISAGASSGSPSSGSGDSPYSPGHYPNHNHMHSGNPMTLNIANDMQQELVRAQMSGGMRVQAQQTQVSPNSDFLSPYPAQTPGSHHSQVSPQTFMLDSQHNYPIDNYLITTDDFNDINIADYNPSIIGHKRQRMSDGSAAIIKNENYAPTISTPLPGGLMHHQNSVSSLSESPHGGSLDDFDECNKQRTIGFVPFDPQMWSTLYDQNQHELSALKVNVVADKGFNYSSADNCFVNQKKNHFQITVLIKATNESTPCYVMTSDRTLHEVKGFKLAFCGVKAHTKTSKNFGTNAQKCVDEEMTSSEIQIRQSQTDRKPVPHDPVQLNIAPLKLTKVTVPRLHFSETTMNNHRKNGRPNPDQRFFYLIVKLLADTPSGLILVQAYASDRVIVRASNPGQFEPPEAEVSWQRSNNVLHTNGPVAIGTEKAINDAQLTVLGNIVSTGQHTRPSDRRVKEDIVDLDTRDAMDRIANVRIVEYSYKPEIAHQWGLSEENRHRVGVIAQELAEIIPDAVKDNGEFLTVDDARIFYDTVAAAQELYRLTGNLECKIEQVERISSKLARYAQKKKQLGASMASGLSDLTLLINQSKKEIRDGIGDDKNVLSQSRFSLTSITPSTIEPSSASQIGYGRSRRHRPKYQQEQSLCNSKITQMTMIALVIIMSLCLITMCTLYVLDWYHRTYVYGEHQFPRQPPTFDPSLNPGKMISTIGVPRYQPVDPLLGTCSGRGCPLYCCGSNDVRNSTTVLLEKTTLASFVGTVGMARIGSSPQQNSTDKTHSNVPKPLESGVVIKQVELGLNIDSRYCIENSCVPRKGRYTLYVPLSPYMPNIPLRFHVSVGPGMYIDECGHVCHFEHKPCESNPGDSNDDSNDMLEENSNDVQTDIFSCGGGKRKKHAPSMSKVDANTFELEVGHYKESAYRFRIGYSADTCLLNLNQQGRSFDEYILVFYRNCAAV